MRKFFSAHQSGFSLIELMIVVLIIGISTSMAMIYIDNSDDRLKTEARRLFAMAQLARDDAIINGKSLGLIISEQSYSFVQYTDRGQWQEHITKPYKTIALSDDIKIRSLIANTLESQAALADSKDNLIYFLPTGEGNEFQVWLSNANETEFVLSGNLLGELSLKQTQQDL